MVVMVEETAAMGVERVAAAEAAGGVEDVAVVVVVVGVVVAEDAEDDKFCPLLTSPTTYQMK